MCYIITLIMTIIPNLIKKMRTKVRIYILFINNYVLFELQPIYNILHDNAIVISQAEFI